MAPGWSKLSSEEIRLAKMWYHEDGYSPLEIAELLHRDKSTLTRLLCLEVMRKQDGRPRAFTEEEIDKIVEKPEGRHGLSKRTQKNEINLKSKGIACARHVKDTMRNEAPTR